MPRPGLFDDLLAPDPAPAPEPAPAVGLFDDLVGTAAQGQPQGHYADLTAAMGIRLPRQSAPALAPLPPDPRGLFERAADSLDTGVGVAANNFGRGLGTLADVAATPLARLTGDSTPEIDAYSREMDMRQQAQNDQALRDDGWLARGSHLGASLVPWVANLPLAVASDAGNRYADTRGNGAGPGTAAAAAVAQGAVDTLLPGVASKGTGYLLGPALDAVASKLGTRAAGAIEHGAAGAATGTMLSEGSAGISAAAGDPERARAEMSGAAESGGMLGLLGTVAGGLAGRAPRPLRERLAAAEDRAVAGEPPVPPAAAEAPAAPAPGMFADLVEPAPAEPANGPGSVPPEAPDAGQIQDTPPAAEPTGMFADLVTRTPLAEGVPLNDIGALRARAEANARGELDQAPPSPETPTPIMGSPVLPETTAPNEAHPEAAPHVQGEPGEPAPEDRGLEGEAGGGPREPAAAAAQAEAGDAPRPLLTEAPDAVRGGRGRAGADAGPAEARPADAAPAPVPAPGDRAAQPVRPAVPAPVDAGAGGEPARAVRPGAGEAPAAPVADRPAPAGGRAAGEPAVADQRATSSRPDLAIPSHEPATREVFKAADQRRTAAGEPAVRSRASQTEAAAERVAADPGKEITRIRKHVESGGALSEQDAQILRIRTEQHVRAGDHVEAVKTAALYRRGKGEGARATGSGADPLESAPKRAQRLVTDAMLEPDAKTAAAMDDAVRRGDRAAYDRALESAARQNAALVAEVKRLTGLDPHDLAGGAEPKRAPKAPKPTAKERTGKAVLTVDREYRDLKTKLKEALAAALKGSSQGSTGGEVADLLTKIVVNRIKAGVLRAADVALDIAKMLPRFKRDAAMQKAFAEAWKKETGEDVEPAKLFEKSVADQRKAALDQLAKVAEQHANGAGAEPRAKRSRDPEVQAILDTAAELRAELRKQRAKPNPTLEQKVGAARDRLAAAVERHAGAMGQTDAERTATIAARRAKPSVEPEVQALMDEVSRLGKEVRERDESLEPPKPPPPTLDEQVASAQEKLNAAIERHHQAMGETPAERLAAIEAKKADRAAAKEAVHPEVQALLDQRKALDAEVRKRDRIIYQNAMRVLDAIATVKSDPWDKVYEYRRNVVHTSLRLPLKKIASDVSNTLLHLVTDFALRPLINKLPGGHDPAEFRDAAYVMRGMLPGLREGWRNALESWATQRNVWQEQLDAARMQKALEAGEAISGHSDEFHQRRALTGRVGKLTSFNIRATGAFQTFAETLLAHMQVGAEAFRRAYDPATGERLTGQALEDHMHRETSDLASESWTKADTTSKDVTMVTPHKVGPIAWLNKLANLDVSKGKTAGEQALRRLGKEMVRHTFLFRTLPFNSLVKGIYHATPLNGLTILARGAKSLTGLAKRGREGWTYNRADFNTDAAKHALGWGVMLAVSSMLDDDKGQPRITGFGPWKPSDSDIPAPPEHSIRVNGEWHDYSGMGPLSGAIGLAVDTLRGIKGVKHGKSGEDASADVLKSVGSHVVNESYLRGLRDLTEATQSSGKGAKLVGTFASSFYPTMFKDLGKATTGTVPDRQTKESGFWNRTAQVAEQQLSLPGVAMTPSVDLFGKDIAKDDGHGLLTSFVDRAINPFTGPPDVRDGDADPYRKMLVKWNEEHPDDQLLPKTPDPSIMVGRKQTALTPAQYHALCADAGERLMGFLKDSGINTANPTQEDIDTFKAQVAEAQKEAREELKFQLVNATASPGTPGAGASE